MQVEAQITTTGNSKEQANQETIQGNTGSSSTALATSAHALPYEVEISMSEAAQRNSSKRGVI